MQSSFWSNWFKPSKAHNSRKWTLEELGELYEVLLRNGVVTEQNRAVVVETIRTIAEYILWGDQNEPRIFDFFLENNILTYLHKILLQPSNRSGEVAKQVLQTLSIIIQNVRSETGIFFLFSNNHINNIVDLDFDFSDDEVLGYYISFLKTISLKLNAGTVHFFLNSSSTGRGFPLYTRAIRLAHNREGMVRAAVRTLTLNVYSVRDPDIVNFVTSQPAAQYFSEVAHYLAEQVQLLDRHMLSSEGGGAQALGSLDSQLAETEDVLSYVSDLLSLGVPGISQLLANSLWQWVVRPLLLRPLMQAGADQPPQAAASEHSIQPRNSGGRGMAAGTPLGSPTKPANTGHFRHWSWGSGSWGPDGAKQPSACKVRPACAVFVLERLFLLVSYQPLLQQLLLALTCGTVHRQPPAPVTNINSSRTAHPLEDSGSNSSSGSRADAGSSSTGSVGSSSCRACLLGMLSSGQPLAVLLVLRLLVAFVNSKHLPPELLSAVSLLPRKQLQQGIRGNGSAAGSSSLEALTLLLLQQLRVTIAPAAAASQAGQLANGPAVQDGLQADLLLLLTEQYLPTHSQDSTGAADASGCGSSDGSSDAGGGSSRAVEHLQLLDSWMTQQQPDSSSSSSGTFTGFGPQLLSGLMPLLQLPGLPPLGLWLLGWLLHQLLPVSAVTGAAAVDGESPHAAAAVGGGGGPIHRFSQSLGGTADEQDDQQYDIDNSNSRGLSRTDSSGSSSVYSDEGGDRGRAQNQDSRGQNHRQKGSLRGLDLQLQQGNSMPEPEPSPGPPLSTTRAISVQSSLGFEPRASVLSAEQQLLLQGALDAAHAGFAQQLNSMWCEAVFPLLAVEWPVARDMMLRPVLRASSNDLLSGSGVWPVLKALQQQQHRAQQGRQLQQQGSWAEGQSASAQAALECYLAVQRVVALTQVQELLRVGCVAFTPPVPTVSESDLKQVDIQEGYQVDLAPGSALPCVVSFAPGQERRVYFAVAGLSRQQMVALQGSNPSSGSDAARPDNPAYVHSVSSRSLAGASTSGAGGSSHASLLRSLPVAVLADPSPSRPQAGVVLSVAPLLGARPYTDPQVGKWLHVHVRPSVRGLLRIIKTAAAKKGGLLSAMRQLADGHWVLAFSSGDKAALAVTLVRQHATRLQGLYGDALAPMCGTSQQQEELLQDPEEVPVQQQEQHGQQRQTQGLQEQQQQQGQTLQQLDSQQLEQQGSSTHSAAAEQQSIAQQEQQLPEQLPQQGRQQQQQQQQQDTLRPAAPGDPGPGGAISTAAEAAAQAPGSTGANAVWHSPQAEQQTDQTHDQLTMQDVAGRLGHVSLGDDAQQLS